MNMMNNAVYKNNALLGRNGMAVGSPRAAVNRIPTYWTYNPDTDNYIPTTEVPRYAFPTVIDKEKLLVWCRSCNRWEDIKGFSNNVLKTSCGREYAGPFKTDHADFFYGYMVRENKGSLELTAMGQIVSADYRTINERFYEINEINLDKKRILLSGKKTYVVGDLYNVPCCPELTQAIIDRLGEGYRQRYGIKPSVTSGLKSLSLVMGYMLCPFNVNFYVISQHWGLHPCDDNFTSLSSGDTPSAENEMFSSLGIKPTKTVRKLYQKNPYGIIPYAAVHDLGFTDVNLLQKSTGRIWYEFFKHYMISFGSGSITYGVRTPLRTFVQDMLAITDQKTVWNSIERTVRIFNAGDDDTRRNTTDGINMYPGMMEFLTEREKKEILREGFNNYTHDFLLRRQEAFYAVCKTAEDPDKNVPFPLEKAFLDLEYKTGKQYRINMETMEKEEIPDEERWCFYVARDSATLKRIGSEMSNCVGWGYATAVKERKATIVYAMHRNKYKICIEVTPDFTVRQAFGPYNSELTGEAFEAYSEWCKRKHIERRNVFKILVAPR
ncbi:MAG: PcfJ domain-containing protein [Treponema sp.]|nr:PcfJ domain-containing protein [Treponema sp.]